MLLGIDVGTSSIKAMLMEEEGKVIGCRAKGYDVDISHGVWAEQDAQMWWESLCVILQELKEMYPAEMEAVAAIGLSGQMHGLTSIDRAGKTVRPSISWMDQRAGEELEEISEKISRDEQEKIFHNRIFNGFALPSLLWVKNHEPENYERIYKVFQPKDYLRFCLTGEIGTESSDASASLMMDVGKREWAKESLMKLGISSELLPELGKSSQVAGCISEWAGMQTGLKKGIPVVYGAGDQQAQSIGNGAVQEGLIISNIGTGAQVAAFSSSDRYDKELRTHTFCHAAEDAYTIYGAMLSGGLSLKWLKEQILHEEDFGKLSQMAETVKPGSNGLLFLPYLSGERTPLMNPKARGIFFGLSLEQSSEHMVRAVMEGVTYALRDSFEIMKKMGVPGERIIASGGACKSPVWLQIQADILGREVQVCRHQEQACLGACILAGVGVGIYESIEAACKKLVSFEEKIYVPRKEYQEIYEEGYNKFHGVYEGTKEYL
jgi:xylulokinase